jgi:hypothetical protein
MRAQFKGLKLLEFQRELEWREEAQVVIALKSDFNWTFVGAQAMVFGIAWE